MVELTSYARGGVIRRGNPPAATKITPHPSPPSPHITEKDDSWNPTFSRSWGLQSWMLQAIDMLRILDFVSVGVKSQDHFSHGIAIEACTVRWSLSLPFADAVNPMRSTVSAQIHDPQICNIHCMLYSAISGITCLFEIMISLSLYWAYWDIIIQYTYVSISTYH